MDFGRLKHRILIQTYEKGGQDPNTGDPIDDKWVDVGHAWAEVKGISGREFVASSAEQAATTWKIIIRKRVINTQNRLLFDGLVFNIKAVLPNNDKTMLVLMCESGVNNG